ncbi:hypothetical protein D9M71_478780 [compost metagenome]
MRAGGWNTEVPGAEVPGNGRGEQREHHGKAMAGVHIDQQFHGQQVHDGVGNANPAEQDPEKVENAGKEHGQMRRHGFGIDDCGNRVSGVMKAIDELEGEDKGQGEQEAHKHPSIQSAE